MATGLICIDKLYCLAISLSSNGFYGSSRRGAPMFHNILVAVDGSPDADEALTQAIDLAAREHTRLTLITGVQKLPSVAYIGLSAPPMTEADAGARSWAESVLRTARDRVPHESPLTTVP